MPPATYQCCGEELKTVYCTVCGSKRRPSSPDIKVEKDEEQLILLTGDEEVEEEVKENFPFDLTVEKD